MTGTIALSSAMEDYLEVMLELAEREGIIRVTDIAAALNIAKASVTQAVTNLKDLGMVTQERYGPVQLTSAGRECAVKVRQRHRLLRKFLIEVLGVNPRIAEKDACLMEHVVSPQTMEKLVSFLENAGHLEGATVLSPGWGLTKQRMDERKEVKTMRSVNIRSLNELATGEQGRVIRVTATGPVRRRILEMGVTPGTEVSVKGVAPLGDPIEVLVKGYSLSLRKEEAASIFVEVM
jgi:DtxR family Mn-dependent transcriptional regulator